MRFLKFIFLTVTLGLVSLSVKADMTDPLGVQTVPGTLYYGNSFTLSDSPSVFKDSTNATISSPYNFTDDYTFTISSASLNSVVTSVDLYNILGLSNLNGILLGVGNPTSVSFIPNIFSPPPGSVTVTDLILNPVNLSAGDYKIEITGTITGLSGGSYAGVINLTSPVAEPEVFGMMLAGLNLIGFMVRRRRV